MGMSQIGIMFTCYILRYGNVPNWNDICISLYMFIYNDYFKENYMRNFDIPIWECPKSELCLHV